MGYSGFTDFYRDVRRLGVGHVLDPLGDQPHPVPNSEEARRDWCGGRACGACCGGTVVAPLDHLTAILPQPASRADFIRTHAQTGLCS